MANYNFIPKELRELQQWVCWGKKGEEIKKKPFNPINGMGADSTNPTTWVDFETALDGVNRGEYEGIGIMFANGLMGIDLDHVITKNNVSKEAREIIDILDSYSEISQSGTGIHILCWAKKPSQEVCKVKLKDGQGFEMYDSNRYFALTGTIIKRKYEINSRTIEVNVIYKKYFESKKSESRTIERPKIMKRTSFAPKSGDIISKMLSVPKIWRLWNGDCSDYGGDQSRGDLALCCYLSYFTNGDSEKMDSFFRQSALYRDKWNENRGSTTYGEMTIQKANDFVQVNETTKKALR